MATFVREITTSQGDILRIGLSYERKLLSPEVQNVIGDAELMGVELSRVSGSFVIGHEALQAIVGTVLIDHFPNTFIPDFIRLEPGMIVSLGLFSAYQ